MKVIVHSRASKFRRAGFEFGLEPMEIEVDEATLKMLKDEPMLIVVVPNEPDKPGADPEARKQPAPPPPGPRAKEGKG